MKNIYLIIITLGTLVVAHSSNMQNKVHDSHGHGVYEKIDALDERDVVYKKYLKKEQILQKARLELKRLVKNKKISKSFLKVRDEKVQKTNYKLLNDWMVVFHNPKIKNKKYKNLYIFVDAYGDVKGVNYSGR